MSAPDSELLDRPIVIVGPPRSGTSILMNLLAEHPGLARVNEPRITWRYGNERGSDALRPEQARPDVRAHIRERFAAMIREQGAARMVEKTPSNALRRPLRPG